MGRVVVVVVVVAVDILVVVVEIESLLVMLLLLDKSNHFIFIRTMDSGCNVCFVVIVVGTCLLVGIGCRYWL
jgi:hypothetical protein